MFRIYKWGMGMYDWNIVNSSLKQDIRCDIITFQKCQWGCGLLREQKLPPIPSKQAKKFLDGLDAKSQQRLKSGIEKIPEGDIKPYKGNPDYFRLRIGDYRILFKWISNEQISVAIIGSRGQAYKKGV